VEDRIGGLIFLDTLINQRIFESNVPLKKYSKYLLVSFLTQIYELSDFNDGDDDDQTFMFAMLPDL
jgi:hypothetical protein